MIYDRDRRGSIKKATTPPAGGSQTQNDPRPVTSEPAHLRLRGLLEGTDAPVVQAVEDVGEQLAGTRGDVRGMLAIPKPSRRGLVRPGESAGG